MWFHLKCHQVIDGLLQTKFKPLSNAEVGCLRTSDGFQYWQPAPKWRPLPWLANAGNPAMSPHTDEEGCRHLS